jgi:3-phenylpropionate/trans-cinnamate dioxygenase ferredoxin reductase subunit
MAGLERDLRSVVVVGASLAGATAAVTLREEGFQGAITLVGAEPHPPYERPPLSKEVLRGESTLEKAFVRPPSWYGDNEVELRLGVAATRIDPSDRIVELADGETLAYDALLVATGGRNRSLPVPGAELDGVLGLRTIDDAERIRAAAAGGSGAVVVGLGFIGTEVAASLRSLGLELTAIDVAPPLERVLGAEVAAVVAELHRDHGVELIVDDLVDAFTGDGHVEQVLTRGGREIRCDLAVVGVGIAPAVVVAADSGAEIDDGIVVDELCRTRMDGIYAAGDVARFEHPSLGRIRVEHWQHAIRHGQAAARSMLGKGEPYVETPWFWSDQYDANLQLAGLPREWDELVVRGSLEERRFVGFYLAGGRVEAVVALNQGREVRRATPLVAAGARIDPALLRDEDVDLRELAATS